MSHACECLVLGPQQAGKTLLLGKLQTSLQTPPSSSSRSATKEGLAKSMFGLFYPGGDSSEVMDTQKDHDKDSASPFLPSSDNGSSNLYSSSSHTIPTVGVNVVSLFSPGGSQSDGKNHDGIHREILMREVGGK